MQYTYIFLFSFQEHFKTFIVHRNRIVFPFFKSLSICDCMTADKVLWHCFFSAIFAKRKANSIHLTIYESINNTKMLQILLAEAARTNLCESGPCLLTVFYFFNPLRCSKYDLLYSYAKDVHKLYVDLKQACYKIQC